MLINGENRNITRERKDPLYLTFVKFLSPCKCNNQRGTVFFYIDIFLSD